MIMIWTSIFHNLSAWKRKLHAKLLPHSWMAQIPIAVNPKTQNFGDAINAYFWTRLTEQKIKRLDFGSSLPHYLTTGSVMRKLNANSIVIGSGFISADDNLGGDRWDMPFESATYDVPLEVIALRGKLSHQKLERMLGRTFPIVEYFDPLFLFPLIVNHELLSIPSRSNQLCFIPHYIDKNSTILADLIAQFESKGCHIELGDIQTGEDFDSLVTKIMQSEKVVSSSLHGYILGLSFGKPSAWVQLSNNVVGDGFKFYDFISGLGEEKLDRVALHGTQFDILKAHDALSYGDRIIATPPFISTHRKEKLLEEWRRIRAILDR